MHAEGKIPAEGLKDMVFIGHENVFGEACCVQHGIQDIAAHVRPDMDRSSSTVTLDQREHRVHIACIAPHFGPRLATDKGHIRFEGPCLHRPTGAAAATGPHHFPDAWIKNQAVFMEQLKVRWICRVLMPFLLARDEVDGLKPEMKREMAAFEDGADPDRERFPAGITLAQAGTASLPERRPIRLSSQFPQWGQTGPSGQRSAST